MNLLATADVNQAEVFEQISELRYYLKEEGF
jgi:hypothetical protein